MLVLLKSKNPRVPSKQDGFVKLNKKKKRKERERERGGGEMISALSQL